jgi:DMSO/TMAO reductase YedYZ molybdopterin-dependent catalytic subunit
MLDKKVSRREFIKGAGAVLAVAATASPALLSGCFGVSGKTSSPPTTITQLPGIMYSPDVLRANRIPPGQTETSTWPQVQAGATPNIDTATWTFSISGEVDAPATLSYSDFMALPAEKVFSDIHCVTTWTRLNNLWDGFGSKTVTGLVKLKADAKFVIVHANNGFTTNLPIADFLQPDVIFTYQHDGTHLTADHGWPMRLVVPQKYFWKSAKWVTGIEFSAVDKPGFWETQGYNNDADPWKAERFG